MLFNRNLFIVVVLFSLLAARAPAFDRHTKKMTVSQTPNRSEVVRVFKKAIELNEDFKSKLNKIPTAEYKKMRLELERYHEDALSLKLADCVKLLSSTKDSSLAIELFELLISYKNSADEQFSFAFGEIFINNPDLIIETFNKVEKSEHDFLYRQLQWGWMNVIYSKDIPDQMILDSIKKLKQMKFKIYK